MRSRGLQKDVAWSKTNSRPFMANQASRRCTATLQRAYIVTLKPTPFAKVRPSRDLAQALGGVQGTPAVASISNNFPSLLNGFPQLLKSWLTRSSACGIHFWTRFCIFQSVAELRGLWRRDFFLLPRNKLVKKGDLQNGLFPFSFAFKQPKTGFQTRATTMKTMGFL